MPWENDGSPEMHFATLRNVLDPARVIPAHRTASLRSLLCVCSSALRAAKLVGREIAAQTLLRDTGLSVSSLSLDDVHPAALA